MVVVLLFLLRYHDNWVLKLYKKNSYLDNGWLFISGFKVVPEIRNKEELAIFVYKTA